MYKGTELNRYQVKQILLEILNQYVNSCEYRPNIESLKHIITVLEANAHVSDISGWNREPKIDLNIQGRLSDYTEYELILKDYRTYINNQPISYCIIQDEFEPMKPKVVKRKNRKQYRPRRIKHNG